MRGAETVNGYVQIAQQNIKTDNLAALQTRQSGKPRFLKENGRFWEGEPPWMSIMNEVTVTKENERVIAVLPIEKFLEIVKGLREPFTANDLIEHLQSLPVTF